MALEVGALYAKLTLRDEEFRGGINRAKGQMSELRSHYEATVERMNMVGHIATLGLVAGFGAAAYAGLKANSDTEQFLATMTRLTGSTAEAKRQLEELKKFAANTPFEMEDLKQGELVMRAVGLDTEKWRQTIGDTAAAWKSAGKTYMDVVQAIADAQTGELERLKEFGITKQQIIDHGNQIMRGHQLINNKQQIVDQKAFNEVLLDLLKKRYGGMMEVQSHTFSGMMSNIVDFSKNALAVLSKPLFDKMEAGAQSLMNKLNELQTNGTLDDWSREMSDDLESVSNFFENVNWAAVGMATKFFAVAGATVYLGNRLMALATTARALFVEMGPGGWLLLGLGTLAGALYATAKESDGLSLAQIKQAEAGLKQANATDKLIDSFTQLRGQTKLTDDELLQYMDLQKRISETTDTKKIAEYKEQQAQLAKKSGLSNEQLQRLLQLNGQLIKNLPEASQAISKEGNAIVKTTQDLKGLNAQKREHIRQILEEQRILLEGQVEKLEAQKARSQKKAVQEMIAAEKEKVAIEQKELEIQQKKQQIEAMIKAGRKDEVVVDQSELQTLIQQKEALVQQYEKHMQNAQAARADANEAQRKLDKLRNIKQELTLLYTQQKKDAQDIINKNNKEIQQLESKKGKNRAINAEIDQEIAKLKNQNRHYQDTINKANQIIARLQSAGNQIDANIEKARTWNNVLNDPIVKQVSVVVRQTVEQVNPGALISVHNLEHNIMPKYKRHSGGTIPKMLRVPGFSEVNALLKGGETILTERHTNDLINMLERGGKQERGGDIYNINVATPAQEWVGRDVVRHVSRARRRMLI